jgi:hypothetical protein
MSSTMAAAIPLMMMTLVGGSSEGNYPSLLGLQRGLLELVASTAWADLVKDQPRRLFGITHILNCIVVK